MRKKILIPLITLPLLISTFAIAGMPDKSLWTEPGWASPIVSPDASHMLFTKASGKGLYLTKISGGKLINISDGPGSGYRASWSPDGRFIAFKQLVNIANDQYLQVPSLFDVNNERFIQLHEPVSHAGVPTISRHGKVAFTIGEELLISDTLGQVTQQFDLGAYANLTPISANGRWVVYNDDNDQLWLLDLQNGTTKQITDGPQCYFEPQWSPTHFEFVARTMTGELVIFDLENDWQHSLGQGSHASWTPDGEWLIFSRIDAIECVRVNNIDIWAVKRDGSSLQQVTATQAWEDYPYISKSGQFITYIDRRTGTIIRSLVYQANAWSVEQTRNIEIDSHNVRTIESENDYLTSVTAIEQAQNFSIPYIHQVYDTPDWFNGHWACGATSAMMCLAYYSILPAWSVTVSWPNRHLSQFGRYICEKYTFNNYTYNIGSPDKNGKLAYGGYGFIVRNDWRDTKGYMAQYARQHGLSSSVDWYPSRSKVIQEIDNQMPFVLLNDLTNAGHYISVVGYKHHATTLIINDPYGNKNHGYMNYVGKNVSYDWPGYNNGHRNLTTVHCFIYMRGTRADLVAQVVSLADTVTVGDSLLVDGTIVNLGSVSTNPSHASIVLSTDIRFDFSDYLIGEFEIPALMPLDTARLYVSLPIPDSITSNLYAVALLADIDSTEIELSEENNVSYDKVIVRGYPDVFNMWPEDGKTTTNPQPKIMVVYRDRASGIAKEQVRFYLDSEEKTESAEVSSASLTYTPVFPLCLGSHRAEVIVANKLGYLTRCAWNFTNESPLIAESNPETSATNFRLGTNYPNPFNAATKIVYELPKETTVQLVIFSVDGREIKQLDSGYKQAGQHVVSWDGKNAKGNDVASGLYFYRLIAGKFRDTKRMLLLR